MRRPRLVRVALTLFAVLLGFGFPVWLVVTGNDDQPSTPVDVVDGGSATYRGVTFQLTDFDIRPASALTDPARGTVAVVARFRARIDDPAAAKKLSCISTIQNADGWEWNVAYLSDVSGSTDCAGARYDVDTGKTVRPRAGRWYSFTYAYEVPRKRAEGLRPTLSDYPEYPRYLRFEP